MRDERGRGGKDGFARADGARHSRGPGRRGRGTDRRGPVSADGGAERVRPSEGAAPDVVPRRPFWLICRQQGVRAEVFTVGSESTGKTLPVFSHREEAEMFLWFGRPGAAWRVRETSAGEIVSLLYGPCAGVGEVALDPLPFLGDGAMAGLVSLPSEDFVRNLTDGGGAFGARPGG